MTVWSLDPHPVFGFESGTLVTLPVAVTEYLISSDFWEGGHSWLIFEHRRGMVERVRHGACPQEAESDEFFLFTLSGLSPGDGTGSSIMSRLSGNTFTGMLRDVSPA